MTSHRLRFCIVATILTCGLLSLLDDARAEALYKRQDKSGTISFSNVPTDSGYDRPADTERPPSTNRPAATSGLGTTGSWATARRSTPPCRCPCPCVSTA